MSSLKKIFKLMPDTVDSRDYEYEPDICLHRLPSSIDLREKKDFFPPIFNQGQLNSCTANAISSTLFFDLKKQNWKTPFIPSRLFIYYVERDIEGRIPPPDKAFDDMVGATVFMRDCIKSVSKFGFCHEKDWPYDNFKMNIKPPQSAYDEAKSHRAFQYHRLPNDLKYLKGCLAEGFPFVFGINVYQSFVAPSTKQTGVVPIPKSDETIVGGHAIAAVGYDDEKKHIIFRNSFGEGWGKQGYGFMPYDFFAKDAFDFWVVKKIM